MIAVYNLDAELQTIEQLVRIARLTLGTALNQIQDGQTDEIDTEEALASATAVNSEIDRLIEALGLHAAGDK